MVILQEGLLTWGQVWHCCYGVDGLQRTRQKETKKDSVSRYNIQPHRHIQQHNDDTNTQKYTNPVLLNSIIHRPYT